VSEKTIKLNLKLKFSKAHNLVLFQNLQDIDYRITKSLSHHTYNLLFFTGAA